MTTNSVGVGANPNPGPVDFACRTTRSATAAQGEAGRRQTDYLIRWTRRIPNPNHFFTPGFRVRTTSSPGYGFGFSGYQVYIRARTRKEPGRRTFPVAASSLLCNSLPSNIQSSPSLPVFLQRRKTFFFRQSFPNIVR